MKDNMMLKRYKNLKKMYDLMMREREFPKAARSDSFTAADNYVS